MSVDDEAERAAPGEPIEPTERVAIRGLDLLFNALRPQGDLPAAGAPPLAPPPVVAGPKKPLPSFVVKTTFRNCGPLGEGGLGVVWSVRDTALGRQVALKQMRDELNKRPQARGRFIREAQITGLLEHPSIIPVHMFSAEGSPFYTMQLMRGGTLQDAIAAYRKQLQAGDDAHATFRRLIAIFLRVCDAIAYAHSKGVVHRDLKPANVVLGSFGEVFVLDWGLAKIVHSTDESLSMVESEPSDVSEQTRDGQIIGTAAFMAPEQAQGNTKAIDHRTDVFGLGAMLYVILTGMAPYASKDSEPIVERLARAARGIFPAPGDIDPSCPKPLEAVCIKAMAAKPEDRYPSVHILANDIRHWLDNDPVSVYRDPWTSRILRWASHHPSQTTALAGLMAAVLVVASIVATYVIGGTQIAVERQKETLRQHVRQAAWITEMTLQGLPDALSYLQLTMPLGMNREAGSLGERDFDMVQKTFAALFIPDGNLSGLLFVEPSPDGKELVRVVRDEFGARPHVDKPRDQIDSHFRSLVARSVAEPDRAHCGQWRFVNFGPIRTTEFSFAAAISIGGKPIGVVIALDTLSHESMAGFVVAANVDEVNGYLVDETGTILSIITPKEKRYGVGEPFVDEAADLMRQLNAHPDSDEFFEDDWDDYEGLLVAKRIHYDRNNPSRWLLVAIGKSETDIVSDIWRILRFVSVIAAILVLVVLMVSVLIARYAFRKQRNSVGIRASSSN